MNKINHLNFSFHKTIEWVSFLNRSFYKDKIRQFYSVSDFVGYKDKEVAPRDVWQVHIIIATLQ
jgi:hypothetical protein